MSDPHAEGPECDFCGLSVEEDEELEPLFVGSQPKPEPHHLTKIGHCGSNGVILGRPVGEYDAMRNALRDCPYVTVNVTKGVEEVKSVDGSLGTTYRDDKLAVNIDIESREVDAEPDAMVCDICSDMFKSL